MKSPHAQLRPNAARKKHTEFKRQPVEWGRGNPKGFSFSPWWTSSVLFLWNIKHNPFPKSFIVGVSLVWLSFPRGLGTDLAHSTGHCWRIKRAARYTGSQPQTVCIFTARGSNFGFCQFYLGLQHLWAGLQGQACSPWGCSHQWPTGYPTLPRLGHLSTREWAHWGQHPSPGSTWKSLMAEVGGAVFDHPAAMDTW